MDLGLAGCRALVAALLACTTGTAGDREGMRRRAAEARAVGLVALTPTLLRRWFTPAALAGDGEAVRYVRERLGALSAEGYASAVEAAAAHETMAALSEVRLPVTLVVGLDDHVGRGTVEAMAEAMPGARLRAVAGPHMIHLEQPALLRQEIRLHLEWVDAVEAGERGRSAGQGGTGP